MQPLVQTCLLAAILLVHLSLSSVAATPPSSPEFRVAGYLPDYRAGSVDLGGLQRVTDVILFSAEITAFGGVATEAMDAFPWAALRQWKARTGSRLWVAVGGWGKSRHFAAISKDLELRKRFVETVVKLCSERGLDGVDLDWEHPSGALEEQTYGELIAALRSVLHPLRLQVSVTIAGWQRLTRQAIDSVDVVQLMAYDRPGVHASYDGAVEDVQKLLKMGVPAGKLVLGLPFYGRHLTDRNRTLTYREIEERHHPAADVDEVDGVAFNGPTTLLRKVGFAKELGLAGVMIWELGQDATGERALLRTVTAAAR